MYAIALTREKAKEHSFMVYISESLRLAPQGMCLAAPWDAKPNAYDDMTAEQIAEHVILESGLETQ